MSDEINKIITATNTLTTFEEFKGLMLDMLRGYPKYAYFGKFESVFPNTGEKIVEILIRHGVIEKIPIIEVKQSIKIMPPEELQKIPQGDNRFLWYRLAPRGVDLAVSMANLEYSEKMKGYSEQTLNYSEKMDKFTKILIFFGASTLLFSIEQIILNLIFN